MNQVEVKRRQIQSMANILGLVTLLIFGRIIGDNGIAYVAVGYELYSFLFILLGKNIPDALGRILRGRISRGQYKNASRMRRYAVVLQGFLGVLGSILMATCGGKVISEMFKMPHGSVIALILAPAFLLQMFSCVLLGAFQGDGTELFTVIVTVLKKVLLLSLGLMFIQVLYGYGEKVSALLQQKDFVAMYGAMGVACAFVVAELVVFLLLFVASLKSSRKRRKNKQEGMRTTDSFGSLVSTLYGNMLGLILIQLLARLPIWLGLISWQKSVTVPAITEFGVYYGKYLVVVMVLILIIDMIVIAAVAKFSAFRKKEETKFARITFQGCFHFVLSLGLYLSVFLAVMGEQVADIFCESNVEKAASLLGTGAFLILFVGVSDYFIRILIQEGRWYVALCGLGVMNVAFMLSLVLFLNNGVDGASALVYAGLIGTGVLGVLLGFLTCKLIGMAPELLRSMIIPACCACLTGLVCMFLGNAFTPHLGNLVTVIVCLVLSFPIYWIILLLFRTIREKELKFIPGSGWLRFFGQLLQLF